MIFGAGLLRSTIAAYNSLLFASWDTDYGAEKRWLALFFDEGQAIYVPVLAQTFITSSAGSNQTYTSDATWNNVGNAVELVGAGGSGGAHGHNTSSHHATGAGGGAYSKITDFMFAVPGTTQAVVRVGLGGVAVSSNVTGVPGNPGGASWFNTTSDPGVGADNSKASAAGGANGVSGVGSQNGGIGGQASASWGTTKFDGGRGGNMTGAPGTGGSGGGGAGGPNGAGNPGVDTASTSTLQTTAGGRGDGSFGGLGGLAGNNNGGTASEFGADGCGGGGGGNAANNTTAGSGGNRGGGGGGCCAEFNSASGTSGAGANGIIVLTWTPSASIVPFLRRRSLNTMIHLRR